MKFVRREVPLMNGVKVVRMVCEKFTIGISRHGVSLMGELELSKHDDLEALAMVMGEAWNEYQEMRGKDDADKESIQLE
jgi:hypothetical protein